MPTVVLSGDDTVTMNDRVFADFAEGNIGELTFENDIVGVKTGKNGNSLYALNETGRQATFKMRVMRGSADDKYLQNLLNQQLNNFAGFPLISGTYVKKLGDGKGNITNDTYTLGGGVFKKQVEGKTNVEGETDQSVSVYEYKFTNAPRALT